jgi:hypothetical protein
VKHSRYNWKYNFFKLRVLNKSTSPWPPLPTYVGNFGTDILARAWDAPLYVNIEIFVNRCNFGNLLYVGHVGNLCYIGNVNNPYVSNVGVDNVVNVGWLGLGKLTQTLVMLVTSVGEVDRRCFCHGPKLNDL